MVLVSAEHGHGIDKLSKLLLSLLPCPPPLSADPDESRTRIAFIGRPNVGKSSLCNRLLNMERLIVSDVPGTTRETVELDLDYIAEEGNAPWKFRLFDTDGLKRRKRVDSSLDYFSAVRTKHAIEEVDIVFLENALLNQLTHGCFDVNSLGKTARIPSTGCDRRNRWRIRCDS